MNIDTILFDLDGTLWETSQQTFKAVNEICKKYHLQPISIETINRYMGMEFVDCAKNYMPSLEIEKSKQILAEMFEKSVEVIGEEDQINIYDGVVETIKQLKKDFKIGIVSNCKDNYLDMFITKTGLGDFIDYKKTTASYGITKAEAIFQLISEEKIKPIYVGDTIKDLKSCLEVGISFIHARYGFGGDIESSKYINSIRELPNLLKTID